MTQLNLMSSGSLLKGLSDSSSEDSFDIYEKAQRKPEPQMPKFRKLKPGQKLFTRPGPTPIQISRSFIMAHFGPNAKATSLMSSTPANTAFKKTNISSTNSPEFSPITHVKEASGTCHSDNDFQYTQTQDKRSIKKNKKVLRRSKSQEPLRPKYTNPMFNSIVEQLQNLSTAPNKQEQNKNKVKPKHSTDNNLTYTRINATNINKLTKEKKAPKKPLTSKPSVVSKGIGTSPDDELIKSKTLKSDAGDLKSPRVERKRAILVEMQTQTTDSLVRSQENNKMLEKNVTKDINKSGDTRKSMQNVRIHLEFSENEISTPRASQVQDNTSQLINKAAGYNQPGNVTEEDVVQYLELFDENRNTPPVIEISSTLESSENETHIEVPIKTEVLTTEQNNIDNTVVAQPLNEMNDSVRNTRSTPRKRNSRVQKNNTDNNSLLMSPTTRSKSKNTTTWDNSEKENSTLIKKSTKTLNTESIAPSSSKSRLNVPGTKKHSEIQEVPATSSDGTQSGNDDEKGGLKRARGRSKKKSNKVNTFKEQPSKSNRQKTTTATQPQRRPSVKVKLEKSRVTINKRSTMLQPYLAIDRYSGFVQIQRGALDNQQGEDSNSEGLRRSKRDRKLTQLFIQSSILDPAVLNKKSKTKQLSRKQSNNITEASGSLENTNEQTLSAVKNKITKGLNTKQLRSRKIDEAGSSSRDTSKITISKKTKNLKTSSDETNNPQSKFSRETQELQSGSTGRKNLRSNSVLSSDMPIINDINTEQTKSKVKKTKNSTTADASSELMTVNENTFAEPLFPTPSVTSNDNHSKQELKRRGRKLKNLAEVNSSAEVITVNENTSAQQTALSPSEVSKINDSNSKRRGRKGNLSTEVTAVNNSTSAQQTALSPSEVSITNDSILKRRGRKGNLSTEVTAVNNNTFVQPLPVNKINRLQSRCQKQNKATLFSLREMETEKTVSEDNENTSKESTSRKKNNDVFDTLNNCVSETIDSGVCVTSHNAVTMELHEDVFAQDNIPINISNESNDNSSRLARININPKSNQDDSLNASNVNIHTEVDQNENESDLLTRNHSKQVEDSLKPVNNSEMLHDLNTPILCLTNDISTQDSSTRKRSVTFREPSSPKKKKLVSQGETKDLPGTSSQNDTTIRNRRIDVIEEAPELKDDNEEEITASNDLLHAVINKDVVSLNWTCGAPGFPSCSNKGIEVKYILKNIPTSWGHTSTGHLTIGPKEKKPLQIMKKYNVLYTVAQGLGVVVAQGKKQKIDAGRQFYIPLGVEYSITNLMDEPLTLLFQKTTP